MVPNEDSEDEEYESKKVKSVVKKVGCSCGKMTQGEMSSNPCHDRMLYLFGCWRVSLPKGSIPHSPEDSVRPKSG